MDGSGDNTQAFIRVVKTKHFRVVNPYMKRQFNGYYLLVIRNENPDSNWKNYIRSYTNIITYEHSSPDKEDAIIEDLKCRNLEQGNIGKFLGLHIPRQTLTSEGYGCSLHDYLTRDRDLRPVELSDISSVTQQMACALEALRSAGVIHCNINPMNIWFMNYKATPKGLKLTDFSSALYRSDADDKKMEINPFYRAPELDSDHKLSEAMDMWSLGYIMALMMTCCSLFEMKNGQYIMTTFIELPLYVHHHCRLNTKRRVISQDLAYVPPLKIMCLRRFAAVTQKINPMTPEEKRQRGLCVDLAQAMLKNNPSQRITPTEVLKHPFITGILPEESRRGAGTRLLRFISTIKKMTTRFFYKKQ